MMSRVMSIVIAGLFLFIMSIFPTQAFAFSASYIMPDGEFVSGPVMSAGQIQNFLSSKGSFLTSYRIPASEAIGPGGAILGANTLAADVIYQASAWYGISPQTILVTLQKEQSSVTSGSVLWQNQIDCAMGYDYGSGCDFGAHPGVQGFARQVVFGTWQLRHDFECAAGLSSWDGYSCNGYDIGNTLSGTVIASKTAASLYSYTPNINTYAPGSSFYINYTNWFGPLEYNGGYLNVYRFYKSDGTHFYTASESEKTNIIIRWPNIYKYEGVAYVVNSNNAANSVPLYRFFNKQTGTHFYTASASEVNNINSRWGYIFQMEGVAYNVSLSGGVPVHRFYNVNGTHFYTISEAEKNNIIARWPNIYKYEGVAFYVGQ